MSYRPNFDSPKVVSFVALKGGVGKSTICVSVACELASRGYRVLVLDADAINDSHEFFKLMNRENVVCVPDVTAQNVTDLIAKHVGSREFDMIVCDAHGGVSALNAAIVPMSDMIISPSRRNVKECKYAQKTVEYFLRTQEALFEEGSSHVIPFAIVWNDVSSRFPTAAAREALEAFRKTGYPEFKTVVKSKTAFDDALSMGYYVGELARVVADPKFKDSYRDIASLTDELLEQLVEFEAVKRQLETEGVPELETTALGEL